MRICPEQYGEALPRDVDPGHPLSNQGRTEVVSRRGCPEAGKQCPV